jgi:hypothetical protein
MKKLVYRTESTNEVGNKDHTSDLGGEHRLQSLKVRVGVGVDATGTPQDREREEMAAWLQERRKSTMIKKNRSSGDLFSTSTTNLAVVNPSQYKTLEDVEDVQKNHQFRSLFFLPETEKVSEVHPCTFTTEVIKNTLSGKLYISQTYLSYASYQDHISHPIGTPKLAIQTPLTLVIPLNEITSISKSTSPPFLSRPFSSLVSMITSASYISITVRSGKKFWFCSQKKNANLYDLIMGLIRTVEFPESNQSATPIPELGKQSVGRDQERDMSTLKKTSVIGGKRITAQDPLPVGLRFLFDLPEQ